MQSFTLLQYCMLSLVFHFTYQTYLWHSHGLLSLQTRFLPFFTSIIFKSLSTSWYLSMFSFPLPLLLHYLVQQYQWLSPFALSCQLQLSSFLASITPSHGKWTSHNTSTSSFSAALSGTYSNYFSMCSNSISSISSLYLQRSQWTFFATFWCVSYILYEPISHMH